MGVVKAEVFIGSGPVGQTFRYLLLGICAATMALAILGFPIPPFPSRGGAEMSELFYRRFKLSFHDWLAFDGFPYSTSSGFWLSCSLAALLASLRVTYSRSTAKNWFIFGGAFMACSALAAAIPHVFNIPWSNYDTGARLDGGRWQDLIIPLAFAYLLGGLALVLASQIKSFSKRRSTPVRKNLRE